MPGAEFLGLSSAELSPATIFVRLLAATVLAMTIGWEREHHNKPAGLRTHMLVGLGAAAFYLVTIEFMLGELKDIEGLSPDPTRIFQGVIAGIGFLGGGAIIQARGDVKGLTTGAGIWVSGAIGLACGGGYFVIAAIVTAFTLFILVVAGMLERRYLDSGEDDG